MDRKAKVWSNKQCFGISCSVHLLVIVLVIFASIGLAHPPKEITTMEVELVDVPAIQTESAGGGQEEPLPVSGPVVNQNVQAPQRKVKVPSLFQKTPEQVNTNSSSSNSADATPGETGNGDGPVTGPAGGGGGSGSAASTSGGSGSGTGGGQGTGSGSGSGSGTGSGVDWRNRFVAVVESHKRYPMQARRQGVTGLVRVRVTISAGGSLVENSVVSSAGDSRLDNAALDAVRASVPFSHDTGGNLTMVIPIRFNMN